LALTDKKLFWDCFFCLSRACKLKLLQLFHHLMLAVIFITSHVYVARWTPTSAARSVGYYLSIHIHKFDVSVRVTTVKWCDDG